MRTQSGLNAVNHPIGMTQEPEPPDQWRYPTPHYIIGCRQARAIQLNAATVTNLCPRVNSAWPLAASQILAVLSCGRRQSVLSGLKTTVEIHPVSLLRWLRLTAGSVPHDYRPIAPCHLPAI
jgi:hypothetical protein